MADNYVSGAPFSQVAGTLLARKERGDKKQFEKSLVASAIFETIGALRRKQDVNLKQEIEDYQDAYIPIFNNLENNFNDAQQTKKDLLEYDRNPEVYRNKIIDNEFFYSDFARDNNINPNNFSDIKGTKYEKGYLTWVDERRQEIDAEIETRRKNPYLKATSFEELKAPLTKELKNNIRELQNDPAKTSLIGAVKAKINEIFGGKKVSTQIDMEMGIEDYMIEAKTLQENYNNYKTDLNNFYKEQAKGNTPEWMGFFTGKPVYDKYFKDTDKEISDIIASDFEDVADNNYSLQSATNSEVFFNSTPFDEVDEIKVLTIKTDEKGNPMVDENNKFIYEENKNKNAATELARYITLTANIIAASDDNDPNRVAPRDVRERRGLAINELIKAGNLAKESRMGSVVFKVPLQWGVNIQNIDPETISVVDSMVNAAEENIFSQSLNLEDTYEQYLKDRIAARKKDGLDTGLEENKLSQADEKTYVAGQLEFLFNPPTELIGETIKLGNGSHLLGTLNDNQKKQYYKDYQKDYNVRNITLEKLLGLGEEPFREATEQEFNEMTKPQQTSYNQSIDKRLQILDDLETDISLARQSNLRDMLKNTEINIAGFIENRGTTKLGKIITGLEEKNKLNRINSRIQNIEKRLENSFNLSPKQIQESEDKLKELKSEKQMLELN